MLKEINLDIYFYLVPFENERSQIAVVKEFNNSKEKEKKEEKMQRLLRSTSCISNGISNPFQRTHLSSFIYPYDIRHDQIY